MSGIAVLPRGSEGREGQWSLARPPGVPAGRVRQGARPRDRRAAGSRPRRGPSRSPCVVGQHFHEVPQRRAALELQREHERAHTQRVDHGIVDELLGGAKPRELVFRDHPPRRFRPARFRCLRRRRYSHRARAFGGSPAQHRSGRRSREARRRSSTDRSGSASCAPGRADSSGASGSPRHPARSSCTALCLPSAFPAVDANRAQWSRPFVYRAIRRLRSRANQGRPAVTIVAKTSAAYVRDHRRFATLKSTLRAGGTSGTDAAANGGRAGCGF